MTFYVSTTGDDANDGSEGAPFRSIQHALTIASATGQETTIEVAEGTYNV